MKANSNKSSLRILFFTIFLNLTGFAIILPLYPAILAYYLPAEEAAGGFLGGFVRFANTLAGAVGQGDSMFMTSVAFGCLLGSIYGLLQFVFAPIWGRLSDRIGRRRILLLTLGGTAISSVLWIFAGSFGTFVWVRVLAGVMAGNLSVTTAAAADLTSKRDRTKGMAVVGIAFGLGFLLGPAMGGLLTKVSLLEYWPKLSLWGVNPFSSPALVSSILAIANFVWVYLKFGETLPKEKRRVGKSSESLLQTLRGEGPAIQRTNLIYFIFILAFSGLEFTLAFLATERFNYTPVNVGMLFLYIGFVLLLAQGVLVRRFSPIVGERVLAMGGMVSGMISYGVIAFASSQVVFFVGSAFLALSVGLASPSLSGLVSLYATEETQGRNLGVYRSAGSLARACGPIGAAGLYFYFGAKITYLSVACVLLWPLGLIFLLPKPVKDPIEIDS